MQFGHHCRKQRRQDPALEAHESEAESQEHDRFAFVDSVPALRSRNIDEHAEQAIRRTVSAIVRMRHTVQFLAPPKTLRNRAHALEVRGTLRGMILCSDPVPALRRLIRYYYQV